MSAYALTRRERIKLNLGLSAPTIITQYSIELAVPDFGLSGCKWDFSATALAAVESISLLPSPLFKPLEPRPPFFLPLFPSSILLSLFFFYDPLYTISPLIFSDHRHHGLSRYPQWNFPVHLRVRWTRSPRQDRGPDLRCHPRWYVYKDFTQVKRVDAYREISLSR